MHWSWRWGLRQPEAAIRGSAPLPKGLIQASRGQSPQWMKPRACSFHHHIKYSPLPRRGSLDRTSWRQHGMSKFRTRTWAIGEPPHLPAALDIIATPPDPRPLICETRYFTRNRNRVALYFLFLLQNNSQNISRVSTFNISVFSLNPRYIGHFDALPSFFWDH